MGCFLGCFGLKKKNKHRKPRNKCLSIDHIHGSYIPLDSDVSFKVEEKHLTSDSELKNNEPEPSKLKIKKKVSFNLNVKAYEPIRNEEDISSYISESEEERKWEINTQSTNTPTLSIHEEDSKSVYPSNYRYQNCRESYDDEEDEFKLYGSDLDFDDVEDIDEYEDEDEIQDREEDFPWKMDKELDNEVVTDLVNEERNMSKSSSFNARDRSRYVLSVLNPVENTSQWKAMKAKTTPIILKHQKENIVSNQETSTGESNTKSYDFDNMRDSCVSRTCGRSIAVDASLSNWLDDNTGREIKRAKT